MRVIWINFAVFFQFYFLSSGHEYHNASHTAYSSDAVEDLEMVETSNSPRSHPEYFTSYISSYHGDQALCPPKTFCSRLSECRLLLDLMDRSCLLSARMKELTCGYVKNEVMVCCPSGGSPFSSGQDDIKDPNNPSSGLNEACGRPQLNGWQNGYHGLGSQPWVVRIGFKSKLTAESNSDNGQIEYPCCGSLITSSVVLTAAHCAEAKSPGRTISSVRVGEYDMRTDPDCTMTFCGHRVQNIAVSRVVSHPGYEKSIYRHDVALIFLKTKVNYSISAQPVCLQDNTNRRFVGIRATLAGFGKLPDDEVVSPQQHEMELPVVSLDVCSRIYDRVIKITSNHLCVGGEPKKDACSGFGGAPLVHRQSIGGRDRYVQIGMVSFGSDRCGSSGVPSVYTNIQDYYQWIKANIP